MKRPAIVPGPAHARWVHWLAVLVSLALAGCAGQPALPSANVNTPSPPTSATARPTPPPSVASPTLPTLPATLTPPVATGKPLVIGQLTNLSGALRRYGEMETRGFALGLEYATQGTNIVAGRPLRVTVRDTEGKTEQATDLARQLVRTEGAEVLQCCANSALAMAVQQVAKETQKVLMIDPAASPELTGQSFNRYTFRTSRTTDQDILAAASYLTKNGGTTFAQLAPDDAFGRGTATAWRKAVEQAGGKFILDDLFISPETTDFSSVLQQVQDAKPQVFIMTWAGDGFEELFARLQHIELTRQMTVATVFSDNVSIRGAYGGVTDLIGPIVYHYALPKNPVNDWLVAQHQRRFGAPPDIYTAGGMAAGIALVEALKKTGGETDADKLIAALEGLTFDSPKGKMTIRAEDHVALQTMYVVRLKNTTDPQFRFFELLAERKPEDTAPPVNVTR
ncbi:MAG: ABC transporter substrate-binding protein [Anaerolineae bacterium]|nr:ABC transporter substrate-binding protein [Anaerolineae bacterium]